MKQNNKIWQKFDIFSLRLRLIMGIALVSALGLGGLAGWTSWNMQQILINSHKYNISQIAERLPRDVQLYQEMMYAQTSLQKAINNLTDTDTFVWIKDKNNKIIAKSNNWNLLPAATVTELMSLTEMSVKPELVQVNQRYFVLCGGALPLQGKVLDKLFVAQDVTREQIMFIAMVRSLVIASILVVIAICVTIAFYIQASLQPLRQLNQMTAVISLADLGAAELYLDHAPSEVKELATTFNMMLSRLYQSWEQERQFVSNVSHELRTPLTIVNGYLQSVLRRHNNLTSAQIEALETASIETERTIRLLQDLLDLARADSGYLHLRWDVCLLNDLVTEVVSMGEQYSKRVIKIESINQRIEVKIDYNRFKQVLLNLIDNAVKYSPADTEIFIKLNFQREEAIIQVCDQGYGIPLQHQSRIFERFYRVDEARTSTTGGCGLGLSIVKTFVESMGGHVSVRSRLGEGSIFTISLPASLLLIDN
ncbi:two-component sensor histidine kinase [Sphaerospermopsis aphanizomenoides BCCUSP55]|uniref:sensor histidine kinase n=1 Tax=Sphaerospermopsis aphanizomenoides TaxID=459663 RepID=UPI001905B590|nr:ATP-binding protein [Sphaerospermopsis aphanizomenoides]MBK1988742.1 two-component sensor histidine kinase [Sphaerospermopsis aphanizomenoides BCCUSP55]